MASSIGIVLVLLGLFVIAIGYGTISQCLRMFSNDPACWSSPQGRYSSGVFGFYAGAIILAIGTIILVGPYVARVLGNLKEQGADSK